MQFRKITDSKYIGPSGLSLIRCNSGLFSVFKNNCPTKWDSFASVDAASAFLDQCDEAMDISKFGYDDLNFIVLVYADRASDIDEDDELFSRWDIDDTYSFQAYIPTNKIVLNLYKRDKLIDQFDAADEAISYLDDLVGTYDQDLFAKVIYRGSNFDEVCAARDRRSSRDITRNLIRVKSSNVWAYGIEMKDDKRNPVGDLYVQFKGKNGGPGDVYKYYDVPVLIWRKLLSAPSKGHAMWKYIIRNFPYSKLTGDKRGKWRNAVN